MAAETELQLPPRDDQGLRKKEERERKQAEEARDLRTDHRRPDPTTRLTASSPSSTARERHTMTDSPRHERRSRATRPRQPVEPVAHAPGDAVAVRPNASDRRTSAERIRATASTTDVAKDRAGDVKDSAKDAAASVAGTAKEQAGSGGRRSQDPGP